MIKPAFLTCIFSLLTAINLHAYIPVSLHSEDDGMATRMAINALASLINRHPAYQVTNDDSELHAVINITATTNGGVTAYAVLMEIRPPRGTHGIPGRARVAMVDADDVLSAFVHNMSVINQIFRELLVENKMVEKFEYMRSVTVDPGDLNEVSRLMRAANSAAARGRL